MKLSKIILSVKHLKRDLGYIRELMKISSDLSADYNDSSFNIFMRGYKLLREFRFVPFDSKNLGMLHPEFPKNEIKKLVSREHFSNIQVKVNPMELAPMTEDKSIFYKYCESCNIPHPKNYFNYFRNSGGFTAEGNSIKSKQELLKVFQNILPESFVIKPHSGVYGRGIKALYREGNIFTDCRKNTFSAEQLADYILYDKVYKNWLVQEMLSPHSDISKLTESKSVSTVRGVTIVNKAGKGELVYAVIKLISGANFVDNFELGTHGNLLGYIDLQSGKIKKVVGLIDSKGIATEILKHPQSGVDLIDFELPLWGEYRKAVEMASEKFKPIKTIGWDAAITNDGTKIIEGNILYDAPNFFRLGRMLEGKIKDN